MSMKEWILINDYDEAYYYPPNGRIFAVVEKITDNYWRANYKEFSDYFISKAHAKANVENMLS